MNGPELLLILIILGALWWLLIETEGVYLGRRVVIWLYDLYATRYDRIKENDEVEEHLQLAQPILTALRPHTDPMVLDVATGTGRMPLALCQHARFNGHIIAVDLSMGMLRQAADKLETEHFREFATLMRADAAPLPFDDAAFDLITCMEALEFLPDADAALAELVRVLRPGGVLLTTLRQNTRWMPGRIWTEDDMRRRLMNMGLVDIHFVRWQLDYQQVWARKPGDAPHIGAYPPEEALGCPICDSPLMVREDAWCCIECDYCAPVGAQGIIDLTSWQQPRIT